MTITDTDFLYSPLITPERILRDYEEAFSIRPKWCHSVHHVTPEGVHPSNLQYQPLPIAIITLGKTQIVHKGLSLAGLGFAFEITRLPGISIVTNQNGSTPPRHYVRIVVADYPEDLTTLSRTLCDTGPYEELSPGILRHSLDPEHMLARPSSKQNRHAREVILGHAERLARKYSERDPSFDADAYVTNLRNLLSLVDRETSGEDWTRAG